MKAYKILHKPTGLFYTPCTSNYTNLTRKGKLYENQPSIAKLGCGIRFILKTTWYTHKNDLPYEDKLIAKYLHINFDSFGSYTNVDGRFSVPATDWQIIEI